MKVLYLTNIPSPYKVDFFNELGKYCDLTVLYELDRSIDRDENWKANEAKHFTDIYLNGRAARNDSALSISVLKYLNLKKYDLIIVGVYSTPTGMLAVTYLKAKKIPFILSSDGGIIKKDSLFKRMTKKYFIGSAMAWLSTGEKTTEYLVHYGAKKENVHKYPFTSLKSTDMLKNVLSNQDKEKIKKELNITSDKVVISVGQFIPRKGYDILLNSCKSIDSNAGVYIIGGEPPEEYLELKKSYQLENVHFVGFKTKEELKKYYLAADLFVLPTREDIWGLVINEAMAYGLPVVTTNNCIAGTELVKENGYIVPVDNVDELAKRINKILIEDSLRLSMSNKSLTSINNYTIEHMAKQHFSIFEEITQLS